MNNNPKSSDKTVSVVIPAFNEEFHIKDTLSGIPELVATIIVIDDGSTDETKNLIIAQQHIDNRIRLISHQTNLGLGSSLVSGYLESLKLDSDITVIMAGDNQMDPNDLENLIRPLENGEADYVKGNRLFRSDVKDVMPGYRFIGNSLLTFLTKFATGYWHVIDPQCGYTAISRKALSSIPIENLTKGYGYNAHILNMLNLARFRVSDVEVRPIYGPNTSKIKLRKYVPLVSKLLLKLFQKRIIHNYFWRNFHPLIFFYALSLVNSLLIAFPLLVRFFYLYLTIGTAPITTLILISISLNISILSFFFAVWFDMEDNKDLIVKIGRSN